MRGLGRLTAIFRKHRPRERIIFEIRESNQTRWLTQEEWCREQINLIHLQGVQYESSKPNVKRVLSISSGTR